MALVCGGGGLGADTWQPRQVTQRRECTAVFTGIVQGTARVKEVQQKREKLSWTEGEVDFISACIQFPEGSMEGVQIGASVAINGTCLTV